MTRRTDLLRITADNAAAWIVRGDVAEIVVTRSLLYPARGGAMPSGVTRPCPDFDEQRQYEAHPDRARPLDCR